MKTIKRFLGFAFFVLVSQACFANNYHRVIVDGRVSLEVPSHWSFLDEAERRNLSAAAEAVANSLALPEAPTHVASLAVNAVPDPPGAIVRLSFLGDVDLRQDELNAALASERVATIAELEAVFESEAQGLKSQLEINGMRLLEREAVQIQMIDGRTAIKFSYRRTSVRGPSPFHVSQYHVPLGDAKMLLTLSFRESDAVVYENIMKYVLQSVRFL